MKINEITLNIIHGVSTGGTTKKPSKSLTMRVFAF